VEQLSGYSMFGWMVAPLVRRIRWGLGKAGLELVRRKNVPYGYSPWIDVRRLSDALHRPIDCVFDVGANIGQTCIQMLEAFPGAHVHAFEPHPTTFAKLRSSVSVGRVTAHQLALSDRRGTFSFYEYDGEDASSKINSLTAQARFAMHVNLSPREIKVPTNTVDMLCQDNAIEAISLLKIDTEGHDLDVLKGASRMLSEKRIDFIYAEFNDFFEKPGTVGGSLNKLSEYLAPFGFHFVATYTDFIITERELLPVASVLMVHTD
jgi:FkbM family methyltransferase